MNQIPLFKNLTNNENNQMMSNNLQLDKVVTVENCFYYMSLIESFYEVEQSLGPQLFKLFIIAGERRYLDMLHNVSKGKHILEWDDKKPVPLDVAYAWHAHLLAPYQYREDVCYDNRIKLPWAQHFPLKAMHEQRINGKTSQLHPHWTSCFYVYPFQLTKVELAQTTPLNNNPGDKNKVTRFNNINDSLEGEIHERRALYISCASCNSKIYFNNWIDYAAFRTDSTVVLQCPSFNCKHPDNTVDSLVIANLLSALSSHHVKGTKLNIEEKNNTLSIVIEEERNFQAKIKERIDMSKNVYYGSQCWDAVLAAIGTINANEKVERPSFTTKKEENKYTPYALEFSNIIQTTYKNNPLGLSLDLAQAMLNQRQFIRTIITKVATGWKDPIGTTFPQAIKDYHDFLLLLKIQKSRKDQNAILPTWAIDLAWHVHMLHPSSYYKMTQSELGQVPIHGTSNVTLSQIEQSLVLTKNAWNQLPSSFTRNTGLAKMKDFAHRTVSKKAARENKIYNRLRDKFLNGGNITSRKPIMSLEDISYHSDTAMVHNSVSTISLEKNIQQRSSFLPVLVEKSNPTNTTIYSSTKEVEKMREHILSGIDTYSIGYGYIGTILDKNVKGRATAKTYAPWNDRQRKKWTKRCKLYDHSFPPLCSYILLSIIQRHKKSTTKKIIIDGYNKGTVASLLVAKL
ncbi:hypothetical protein BDA99DRAFT_498657 [Phascolomyces articulosus]|uniref:Uncharacterized protein n=1 Tax=Phascolomyces articulosus TaxID=60185 RepID=A0AAD5K990_9FUNG|nr:hypothetical protein BDA99DRAFT_498657 [Phascolomyces articulosus]